MIPPYGQIAWVQRVLPLDTELQRFNGQPLPAPQAFQVSVPAGVATTEVRDHFAPGTFLNRTKAEQLNQATFERLPAGFSFGFSLRAGDPTAHNVTINCYLIPDLQPVLAVAAAFPISVIAGTGGRRAATGEFVRTAPALSVSNEAWVVRDAAGAAVAASSQTDAHTRAARGGGVAVPAGDVVAMRNV